MLGLSKRKARNQSPPGQSILSQQNSSCEEVFSTREVPSPQDLERLLQREGVDTKGWGKGTTKDVLNLWKELKHEESELQVWRTEGRRQVVRVVHVLHAKVSSEENYARNIFLFNTWQQNSEGQKKNRCSLLSEKLRLSEMPLERHLHEVCQRAVSEELEQVVDGETLIMPGSPLPRYNAATRSKIRVLRQVFLEHVIEMEQSKSFPGLSTAYHLHRVDIICSGLPTLNFNTLEFHQPDKAGNRKLKYMHAWVWLKFDVIQRYLFEGSTLKERVSKGTFDSAQKLEEWLSQFGVALRCNSEKLKGAEELYQEVESGKCSLEHYGRVDGLPILLRVAHVLQVKLTNRHHQADQTFLIQEAKQKGSNSNWERVGRHLSTKLNPNREDFDHDHFAQQAINLVEESIYSITDVHYTINPKAVPKKEDLQKVNLIVEEARFECYRHYIDKSPSYEDILTMYHMYTVLVVCDGLPNPDFASLAFEKGRAVAYVWRWATWEISMDMLCEQIKQVDRRAMLRVEELRNIAAAGDTCLRALKEAVADLQKQMPQVAKISDLRVHLVQLEAEVMSPLDCLSNGQGDTKEVSAAERLPPAMVPRLTDHKLVTDDFLAQVSLHKRLVSERSLSMGPRSNSKFSTFSGSDSSMDTGLDGLTLGGPVSRQASLSSPTNRSSRAYPSISSITHVTHVQNSVEDTSSIQDTSYSPSPWLCCTAKKTNTELTRL